MVDDAAVAVHVDEARRDAVEEVAVVADDHERARPAVEQVLERGERVRVEVVRRLVEQQHVRLAHQEAHQLQATALAAREVAHLRPLALAREDEALAGMPAVSVEPSPTSHARARPSSDSSTRLSPVEIVELLREVREAHRLAGLHGALGRRERPRTTRRSVVLPVAVHADDPDAVARAELAR